MGEFFERRISAQRLGAATLLQAIEADDGQAEMFFSVGDQVSQAVAENLLGDPSIGTIGNAPCIRGTLRDGGVRAYFEGEEIVVALTTPEPEMLEGRDVAVSIRNGETAAQVCEWLEFHAQHQGMNGALILDRSAPDADRAFVQNLRDWVTAYDGDLRVIVVHADVPLGQPDTAAEHSPYATPGAPGKDRMKVPKDDPWHAPLGAVQIYELLRKRFLGTVRAAANFDVHDLVPSTDRGTIFDQAAAAPEGMIQLVGRACYPWRVRNGEDVRFADHICVQFDEPGRRGRWCVAPANLPESAVFRLVRIGGVTPRSSAEFYRCMALRHRAPTVSKIVPKASLIEHAKLIDLAKSEWGHDAVRMPEEKLSKPPRGDNSVTIVTCMKNEGPFILEWLAYHRAIGIEGFLVYTNDCTDGTNSFLQLLQDKGYVQHRNNDFHGSGLKPQHYALQKAETEDVVTSADWAISMDVDEFVNVKTGDGTITALFAAVPDANLISCTWRLFGNADIHGYEDRFLIEQFTRCAPEFANKPHQAWGFKTLFKNIGLFKKLGVHRPKGLKPQIWDKIRWYNGSGVAMPRTEYRNAWRSTARTYGYDIVQLNHYAVRSAESFLVKRDRGRVNHVDRDQGMAYWFRMNNNGTEDLSIQRMMPKARAEFDRLMEDSDIRAAHEGCVAAHRAKIAELKAAGNYAAFYDELTSERLEKLSRMHHHFGANVFLSGPESIPDEIVSRDPEDEFFFTVEKGETAH
ncbi:glycosyltransferase family 2 protein [Celeribacter arenosi]|uniref:Glycosyl transferase family 2 n=1 Tax=Celeribacter arenosi TaxID=792649 RepID=A0ABP7K7F5_9RHOB